MSQTQFHAMPDGRKIAYRFCEGSGPTLVFLPGYMSDMEGGKATALFDWSKGQGRACLLLDYSGCGASEGDFADGTLTRWRIATEPSSPAPRPTSSIAAMRSSGATSAAPRWLGQLSVAVTSSN